MNFVKKVFGFSQKEGENIEQINQELFQEFREASVQGSVYQYDRKTFKKQILAKQSTINLDYDLEAEFEYFLHIEIDEKYAHEAQEKEYFLPINEGQEFKYFVSKRESKNLSFDYLNIEFNLDENNTIRIMINITNEADKIDALIFLEQVCKLLYQNKYKKSYTFAKERDEYNCLMTQTEKGTMQNQSDVSSISSYQMASQYQKQADNSQYQEEEQKMSKDSKNYPTLDDLTQDMQKLNLGNQSSQDYSKKEQTLQFIQENNSRVKKNEDQLNDVLLEIAKQEDVVCAYTGKYCMVTKTINHPLLADYVVFCVKTTEDDYDFTMNIYNQQGKQIYSKRIDDNLNYEINVRECFIKWLHFDISKDIQEVLIVYFDKSDQVLSLSFKFNQAVFEAKNQKSLGEVLKKQDDQDFMQNYFANQNDLNQHDQFENSIVQNYQDQKMEFEEQDEPQSYQNQQGAGTVAMDQGRLINRAFISKNDLVKVYTADEDNNYNLKFETDLPQLKNLNGQILNPQKLHMIESDTKMLIMDKDNKKQIYQLDLAKGGQIVRELKINDYNVIGDFCMEKKHQELTQDQVFNACNSKNLYKLDPRVKNSVVADIATDSKIYSTNNEFTSLITNKTGNVAVGSANGDIRLYDKIGKNAKNLYPGFGDSIRHIETTKDGRWILATCKNYLILLPTFGSGAETNSTGFTQTLKYNQRKLPRQLKVLPEDLMKFGIKNVDFSKARFDEKEDGNESFIVAGLGKNCVIWSFSSILRGNLYDYCIQPYKDDVQDVQFKFNQESVLFAALKDNVQKGKARKNKY